MFHGIACVCLTLLAGGREAGASRGSHRLYIHWLQWKTISTHLCTRLPLLGESRRAICGNV